MLTFEENDLEAAELVVSQVYSFHKSATNTVLKLSSLKYPAALSFSFCPAASPSICVVTRETFYLLMHVIDWAHRSVLPFIQLYLPTGFHLL